METWLELEDAATTPEDIVEKVLAGARRSEGRLASGWCLGV